MVIEVLSEIPGRLVCQVVMKAFWAESFAANKEKTPRQQANSHFFEKVKNCIKWTTLRCLSGDHKRGRMIKQTIDD